MFRVTKTEISNHVRATKTTRTKVESRLSACAALVRVVVEVGLPKLRYKTVKALVEHIIQTLPTADAGYCEPLCRDYLKALASLLDYTPHPEHLLRDEWEELVNFCLCILRDLSKTIDTQGARTSHLRTSNGGISSRSASPNSGADHGRRPMVNSSQPARFPILRDCQLDVALCLQCLVSVPNAPLFKNLAQDPKEANEFVGQISEKAHEIVTVVLSLLVSYPKVTSIQHVLLGSLIPIMYHVVTSDVQLAVSVLEELLPLFRRFWDVKDNSTKDPLLILLFYGEILLPRLVPQGSSAVRADLDAVVELLRGDYISRREREQLQLNDLVLVDCGYSRACHGPLCTRSIQLRMGNIKPEQPWCLLATSAAMLVALEKQVSDDMTHVDADNVSLPRKRPKLTRPMEEVFRLIQDSKISEKLYALQLLIFIFDGMEIDESCLRKYLGMLVPYLSDDNADVVSWTMLAITSLVSPFVICRARTN